MSIEMVLIYLVIQFIVQLVLYENTKKLFIKGVFYIWKYLKLTPNTASTILSWVFFGVNIAISLLVKLFTSSGGLTGMTNLGASVFVGLFMAYDVYMFKRVLNNARVPKHSKN